MGDDVSTAAPVEPTPPPGEESLPVAAVEPEPGAVEPSSSQTATEVAARLGALQARLDALAESFEDKIKYDSSREAIIDRLHAELQEYKNDLALKILKPLVLDLIQFHDDLGKTVAARRERLDEPGAAAQLLEVLASYQTDVESMLYRNGIETFTTDQSDFDPKRQRVVKSVPTPDASQNKKVAERIRKGFQYEGRVLRPEMVNVFVAEAARPA